MTAPHPASEESKNARSEDRLTLRKELKGMSLLYVVFVVFSLVLATQCVERRADGPDSAASERGTRP